MSRSATSKDKEAKKTITRTKYHKLKSMIKMLNENVQTSGEDAEEEINSVSQIQTQLFISNKQ